MNDILRRLAYGAAIGGSFGCVAFLVRAAERTPRFLLTLLILWELSPFVLFAAAEALSTRWATSTRSTLYGATVIMTAAMLTIYEFPALKPAGSPAGFLFVVAPPASVLLTAVAVAIAALMSPRQ
jgi:hypothetical protein